MNSHSRLLPISAAFLIFFGALCERASGDVCVYKPPQVRRVCGTVIDSQGVPIPNVAVTVFKKKDAVTHAATNEAGQFDFDKLAPGEYEIDVVMDEFQHGRYKLTLSKPTSSCKKALQIEMEVGYPCKGDNIRQTNKPLLKTH